MFELLLLAGIFAAAYGLWRTFFPSQKSGQGIPQGLPEAGDKKEIALEALSSIWTRHKNTEVSLEQLAGIWRIRDIQPQISGGKKMTFRHPEIQDFYEKYVKGKVFSSTPAGGVVVEILSLLDHEGDCPSVASGNTESDGKMDKNAYDLLAKVPLYQHSLHVAEELLRTFDASAAPSPKILMAALGHDLGKLPSYRKTLYTLGDHPAMSQTILETLEGYKDLPYRDEVSRAIASHHRNPQGVLEEKLKEADMAARRMELAQNVREHRETVTGAGPLASSPLPADRPQVAAPARPATPQAGKDAADNGFATYAPEKKEIVTLKEIPLAWFDADLFLAELKPYINRLDGARWGAFSMSDGHVYFQAGVIEEAARKLGKGDPDIALMGADRELKRNILYTIICILRREKDAIARGLIKEGYFGGPFIARMKDGREMSFYYTPFNAEAFGETVSYFEGLKEGKIKEIEDVQPKIQKEGKN